MEESSQSENRAQELNDHSLNYDPDLKPNIDSRLRQLDMEWVAATAREKLPILSSGLLIGGALTFLFKRKFIIASNFVLVFLLQQALLKHRHGKDSAGGRSREDVELERYALKVERGDYGKLDVIAFK